MIKIWFVFFTRKRNLIGFNFKGNGQGLLDSL